MIRVIFTFLVLAIFVPTTGFARMTSTNYIIPADSINVGGNRSSSTSYILNDAFGESVTDSSTSTNFLELPFIASYLFRVLGISVPATATLTGKTVASSLQSTTGTISSVEITEDGTAGWSVTLTSQHFTTIGAVTVLSGSNSTVDFVGTYDGLDGILDPIGTFIVEVTTGGAVGVAVFKWTDPAGNETTSVTTSSTVVLSNGVSATFAPATYAVGDKWSVGVDVFPYTDLTVTPSTITVVNGDTGVTSGSSETLIGSGATSNAKTLMIGPSNDSTGTYQQDEDLDLQLRANSLLGSFTAQATITIL